MRIEIFLWAGVTVTRSCCRDSRATLVQCSMGSIFQVSFWLYVPLHSPTSLKKFKPFKRRALPANYIPVHSLGLLA